MRFLDTRITRALSTMLVVISSLSQDLVLESNSYRDTAPRVQHFSAFHYYRDGGGGLALSVYNRKLSFSPSISSQMDSYLHHGDYTIKATIG